MTDAIVRVVENRATVVIPGVEALAPLVAATQSAADEATAARDGAVAAQLSLQGAVELLSNVQVIGRPVDPVTGPSPGTIWKVFGEPVANSGPLKRIRLFALTTGTILLNRWSKVGDLFTKLGSDIPVSVTSTGLLSLVNGVDFALNADPGDHIGYKPSASIIPAIVGPNDSGGTYSPSTGSNVSSFTATNPTSSQDQIAFEFSHQVVTADAVDEISETAQEALFRANILSTFFAATQSAGALAAPATGPGVGRNTWVVDDPITVDGVLDEVELFALATGTITLRRFTLSGNNFTVVAGSQKTIPITSTGLVTLRDQLGSYPVRKGEYVSIYGSAAGLFSYLGFSAGSPKHGAWSLGAGSIDAGTTANFQLAELQARFKISGLSASALKNELTPAQRWAAAYRGGEVSPRRTMSASPTITIGAAATGGMTNIVAKDDARLSFRGGLWATASHASYRTVSRSGGRIVFDFYGRRLELRIRNAGAAYAGFSMKVDGEYVRQSPMPAGLDRNEHRYALFDFGANSDVFYGLRADIVAGGSNYVLGDEITLVGGVVSTRVRVSEVAGGAVAGVSFVAAGERASATTGAIPQASTTGVGSGATFNVTWGRQRSSAKARRIELTFDRGVGFGGINLDMDSTVSPVSSGDQPCILIAGDSITDGSYSDVSDAVWADQVARQMSLFERYIRYGTGGRGWIRSGSEFTIDMPGIIAAKPDLLVIALGTNDFFNSVNVAALQAAVTANLSEIMTALPVVRVAILTGWHASSAYDNAIAAGVAALADQGRVRSINLTAANLALSNTSNAVWLSSDGSHPHQNGHDAMARGVGPLITRAFLDMA